MSQAAKPRRTRNRKLIAGLSLAVVAMFGFGYALVPLYDLFCEITGIGGKPAIAATEEAPSDLTLDLAREVTVEFTSTPANDLNWKIRPETRKIEVTPGEVLQVNYLVKNASNRDITGQAVPSVTPMEAAKHFVKLECFCFTQQELAAGEQRSMPVRFYVDARAPEEVKTITLSYSFYEVKNAGS